MDSQGSTLLAVHSLLNLKKTNEAEKLLGSVRESQNTIDEIAYLRAWILLLSEKWDLLESYLVQVSSNFVSRTTETYNSRRAYYCLIIGAFAVDLSQLEEGYDHYTLGLTYLDKRRMNDPFLRSQLLSARGQICLKTQSSSNALFNFTTALSLFEKFDLKNDVLEAEINLGLSEAFFMEKKNLKKAIEYGNVASSIYQSSSNQRMLLRTTLHLARVHDSLKEYTDATNRYIDALFYARAVHDLHAINDSSFELIQLLLKENNLVDARIYANLAFTFADQFAEDHFSLAKLYTTLGRVAYAERENRSNEVVVMYKKAIELLEEVLDTSLLPTVYIELAGFYEWKNEALEAYNLRKKAYALSKENTF